MALYSIVISYEMSPKYLSTCVYDDMLLMGFEPNNYELSYRVAVAILSNVISLNGAEEVGVVVKIRLCTFVSYNT